MSNETEQFINRVAIMGLSIALFFALRLYWDARDAIDSIIKVCLGG